MLLQEEVTGRQGRRRKRLLDDLKETTRYWKLKEEALDRGLWKTRCGRGCGSVVRTDYEMNAHACVRACVSCVQ